MRYNMACTLLLDLHDENAALDMLEPLFKGEVSKSLLIWSKTDPDLDGIRENPRFIAMTAAAEARHTAER
jgi:hypothetical protein